MRRNRILRTLGVMILLVVMATAMYAFTASNTVPDSNAGFGSGPISGYTVSDITYDISGNELNGVDFTLTPDGANGVNATAVSVTFLALDDSALGTYDCDVTGTGVECIVDEVLEDVYGLDVAAAQ